MISRVWSLSAWAENAGVSLTYVQRCPDLAIGYQDYSLAMASGRTGASALARSLPERNP